MASATVKPTMKSSTIHVPNSNLTNTSTGRHNLKQHNFNTCNKYVVAKDQTSENKQNETDLPTAYSFIYLLAVLAFSPPTSKTQSNTNF